MTSRRAFLGGLAAATLAGRTWAAAGGPTHLSAARDTDGTYALYGITATGALSFRVALPARGHAAAAHPELAEAVAFARRPGSFALVIDCAAGAVRHRLDAPNGRHFYGHGAFSEDGTRLFTTENEVATGRGLIGIWARGSGYTRIGEMPSGGTGPHEILRLPGQTVLAVANGGIRTHPDRGREKLNLDTMRPNLTLLDEAGGVIDRAEVPRAIHRNSLRHIAADAEGRVACAFQWQGDAFESPPLLGLYRAGAGLQMIAAPEAEARAMNGYAGSVAFTAPGRVALTSPRGGRMQRFDLETGFLGADRQPDICGVAGGADAALATDGLGHVHRLEDELVPLAQHPVAFDNHLVRIA